ncbi:MAG: DUF3006 domain-containing protein [Ruminococcus sp.]|nr:DUF3006 domain-containing protein [Ruminococcus sp.]MDE5861681.1 DUF3006 domain-containing protein [Ruminococcus sp.]MDE6671610.1 DUF3006 domain-containing protein [Ruminococcus sp.]MDE6797072.1 DUF3006 domain-containing protein [Ruminococcus sp.]
MNVIDRFENNKAVLETDSGLIEIERSRLPENVREGDVVTENNGEWFVDIPATEQRRLYMRELMKRLMKK